MNAIQEALEYIDKASKILEEHVNNPKNFNSIYANDFEIKSYELFVIANSIKCTSNRYGVA
jgi:hypothetical protein